MKVHNILYNYKCFVLKGNPISNLKTTHDKDLELNLQIPLTDCPINWPLNSIISEL